MSAKLRWHRDVNNPMGVWKAWAVEIEPNESMPPYYVIRTLHKGRPERKVLLFWCRSCTGGPRCIDLGETGDFLGAKILAQDDYTKRIAELIKSP